MTGLVSRSRAAATIAEAGHDDRERATVESRSEATDGNDEGALSHRTVIKARARRASVDDEQRELNDFDPFKEVINQ